MSALTSSLAPDESGVTTDAGSAAAVVPPSWAVVSFLLEDTVWCDWLYREFDGERVPRQLHRRPSRSGDPYPERLSISPDPADPTQLENYAESLQSARHLVLVISPVSGKSPILQEHLQWFKVVGGAERVIALVVKGEPASPAAEPGCAQDYEWLPGWLQSRFENNRFWSGGTNEPRVIDARLGVASLAEARAAMMAALLEVEREALTELGIVTRPTTSLIDFPSRGSMLNVPPPTPSNIAFVEIATDLPTPQRHSSLTLWVCAFSALVALAVLGLWPTPRSSDARRLEVRPAAKSHRAPLLAPDVPLVEARPLLDAPMPALSVPSSSGGVAPAGGDSPEAGENAEAVVVASARSEQIVRRDRLTRLAESRMSEGNSNEALEILEYALEAGREVLLQSDVTATDFLDLSLLHRRAGTLAEGLSQPATARKHYENGRRALLDLRAREPLSKDAIQMLADLDSRLRQLRP